MEAGSRSGEARFGSLWSVVWRHRCRWRGLARAHECLRGPGQTAVTELRSVASAGLATDSMNRASGTFPGETYHTDTNLDGWRSGRLIAPHGRAPPGAPKNGRTKGVGVVAR